MSDQNPPPPLPLRLTNLYSDDRHNDPGKVSAYISKADYQYLFCNVLAGPKGTQQAILSVFFSRFIAHLRAAGIPEVYDEQGSSIVAFHLNNLNFNAPVPIQSTDSASNNRRTPSRRRPASGAAVNQSKPAVD